MTTTSYVCDSCGASLEGASGGRRPDQFWTVKIVYGGGYGESTHASREWCRPCLQKNGILPPAPKENQPAPDPPSFEEILREIIREEIGQS